MDDAVEFIKPNRPNRGNIPRSTVATDARPIRHAPAHHEPSLVTPHQPTPRPQVQKASTTSATTRFPRQFFASRKAVVSLGVVVVVAIGFPLIASAIAGQITDKDSSDSAKTKGKDSVEFATVIPGGKSISDLGGWKRVSPLDKEPVYAYTDMINGVSVSVSEQQLPATLKTATESAIADLAKKFNATDKIAADGISIYVGTSAKGPQSVILSKKNLLILIKSQKKIDDTAWTAYAKSLQ